METGRVGEVERLLQVVAVVRAGDGLPVSRGTLIAKVEEYRTAKISQDGINKMIQNDQKRLAELSIVMENVAPSGSESAYVLRDGAWRLPVDLTDLEQGLLTWVMAAAGAVGAEANPLSSAPDDLTSLLGTVPRTLDLAQAAIAGRRRLIIDRAGEEQAFFPATLASRNGRWFLLGRFQDEDEVKAPLLARLGLLRLGDPAELPHVDDPEPYVDPTAWGTGEPVDVELRCLTEHLDSVRTWFPRAEISADGDESVLRFWVRNESGLIDRVIGQAGTAWIASPPRLVQELRDRVQQVVAS